LHGHPEDLAVSVGESISNFISGVWNTISENTQAAWKGITQFFTDIWEGIKGVFKSAIDWIMGMLQPVFGAIDKVRGFGGGVIKGIGGLFSNTAGAVNSMLGIKDGIVQNGRVITTDPADYLIATKNPGSIGGGGVTINVYGDVTGMELVDKVKEALMGQLRLDTKFSI